MISSPEPKPRIRYSLQKMVQKIIGSRKNMDPTEKINGTVSKPLSISIGQQQQQQRKRYMGVRQSPSGRWVAEIKGTVQKIRLWLGTFDTAEAAAHAYDEAACLLRGANTRTNFWPRNKGGPGGSGSSNTGSSSVLSTKVLNQLLEHLEIQRASMSSHSLSSVPSTSSLIPPPPPPLPPPPQHQQQHHKHNQELELIKRVAYGELFSDVGTSSATTHDEIMKGKVQRAVNLVDMDLRLEDFSCFFAPFDIEGRERVEIGTYEYWSMLSAAAKGV